MVVHDEETLDASIGLVRQSPVRYSDQYAYRAIDSETLLRTLILQAFARGDVAIVVPVGQERSMENHDLALRQVRAQRREAEKLAVREWIRTHPEVRKAQTEGEILRIIHASKR